VLPDPSEAVTHLWAEGGTQIKAADVLDRWAGVVEAAGR
jgi:mannose-1-phosphate guanylyltransferase/phosphomannomutase